MNLEEFLLVFEEHTRAKKKVIQAVLADVDRVDPEDFSLFFFWGGWGLYFNPEHQNNLSQALL